MRFLYTLTELLTEIYIPASVDRMKAVLYKLCIIHRFQYQSFDRFKLDLLISLLYLHAADEKKYKYKTIKAVYLINSGQEDSHKNTVIVVVYTRFSTTNV